MPDLKKLSKPNLIAMKQELEEYYQNEAKGRLNTRDVMEEWLLKKLAEIEARIDLLQFARKVD